MRVLQHVLTRDALVERLKLEPLPVLTLWQPWASLIAKGLKRIETRSWGHEHRGPLLIHAAATQEGWEQMRPHQIDLLLGAGIVPTSVPFGALVCLVDLSAVFQMDELEEHGFVVSETERLWGDYSEGRFAWILNAVQPTAPIPVRGQRGLWMLRHTDLDLPHSRG